MLSSFPPVFDEFENFTTFVHFNWEGTCSGSCKHLFSTRANKRSQHFGGGEGKICEQKGKFLEALRWDPSAHNPLRPIDTTLETFLLKWLDCVKNNKCLANNYFCVLIIHQIIIQDLMVYNWCKLPHKGVWLLLSMSKYEKGEEKNPPIFPNHFPLLGWTLHYCHFQVFLFLTPQLSILARTH